MPSWRGEKDSIEMKEVLSSPRSCWVVASYTRSHNYFCRMSLQRSMSSPEVWQSQFWCCYEQRHTAMICSVLFGWYWKIAPQNWHELYMWSLFTSAVPVFNILFCSRCDSVTSTRVYVTQTNKHAQRETSRIPVTTLCSLGREFPCVLESLDKFRLFSGTHGK